VSLEELERQMIRAAQRELAPSPGVRDRTELALLARLAHDARPGSDGSGLRAIGRPAAGAPWLGFSGLPGRMLGVGLALGVLVGGWVGYSLGQRATGAEVANVASGPSTPIGSMATALEAPAPPVPPPSESVEPSPAPPGAPPTVSAGVGASASSEVIPGATGRPAKRASAAPPRVAESSLAEELAMLQRARRALGAGNGLLALGIVHDLDERFPKGVLIEERIATRVFSLCALERVSEARAVGREFLARHSSSVYAERVRRSCIGTPE